jgi:hypothetical protein
VISIVTEEVALLSGLPATRHSDMLRRGRSNADEMAPQVEIVQDHLFEEMVGTSRRGWQRPDSRSSSTAASSGSRSPTGASWD